MAARKSVPTIHRRTKAEIASEEGVLITDTYLRINALKHRWDLLQYTVNKTGYANVRATEGLELDPEQRQQITAVAARWEMKADLLLVDKTWHLALHQWPPDVPRVTGGCDPPDTTVQDGRDRETGWSVPYARVDALLKQLIDEVDALLTTTEGRSHQAAIAREVYRRIGNLGHDVMDRCAACTKDLEEKP